MRVPLLAGVLLLAGCLTLQESAVETPTLPILPDFGETVVVGMNGNEPVTRVGPDGTVYIGALHYVYVSKDGGASFKEVDFKGMTPVYASDTALSVSPAGRAYVAFDWPYLGHTAVCATSDRGDTWECNTLAVPGATDRMWVLAPTVDDVYLITGQTASTPTFAVSHDQGKTWRITSVDATNNVQGADLAWDPIEGVIVEAAADTERDGWGVRTFKTDGTYVGFEPMDLAAPSGDYTLAVDAAGTWWATACAAKSDRACGPAVAKSLDRGKTWQVFDIPREGKTFLLRFVAAGAANRVATGWYESTSESADAVDATWSFVVAQSADGKTWNSTTLATDLHTGPMCSSISCVGDARYAGDFIGLTVDGAGDVHAAWNRQIGEKFPPTTQLATQPWEQVEYARTQAASVPVGP